MRILLFAVLSVFFVISSQAQGTISGQLLDKETQEPLGFANVSVHSPQQDELITGGVSDANGNFKIKVEAGTFTVKIQFVTYKTRVLKEVIVTEGKITNLGNIELSSSVEELGEVTVQAERTQMEMTLDKKVYNVGKDLSNLGGSASEVLSNLPSVTVDVEGNVELRGSANVKVLIDGKPSGLVGLSSTDALRQLQGNLIESIEIITNPSARYDAEGMAGIINIILKKDKQKGVNGSFQVNTGYPHNHGASANMNFRRDWVNLFVNYGVGYRNAPGNGSYYQEYNLDKPASTTGISDYITRQNREMERGGINNNLRFGSDFYLSEKSTLTAAFLYRYSKEKNLADLSFRDYDFDNSFLGYTRREDEETEGDTNSEYSLNYTQKFERKGHQWTADIQYQNNSEQEASDIVQTRQRASDAEPSYLFQKANNDEGEKRLMIQSDYIQPFSEKGKFELGFRSTIRRVKNIYEVLEKPDTSGAVFTALDRFTTNFSYNESIHAGYGIMSNEFKKLSWQVGLRAEMTDINSLLQIETTQRNWNYINFFPSAFLTYKWTEQSQFQLSYSRRINRPRFRDLNPISSFSDNRNFRVGNPQVQPEFTDSYEFGLLQNLDKSSIYTGAYYRNTQDVIQRVTLPINEDGERFRKPFNIGKQESIGVEANVSHEFAKWYRVTGNANFFHLRMSGVVGDTLDLSAKTTSFSTRVSNNFTFKKVFDAQVNVNYRAPRNVSQGKYYSITSIDLGFSRDVLDKDGTLSLSVTDLLNSRKYRWETELDTFYERGTFQWRRGPSFQLTLIYRLNQAKKRGGDRQQGGYGGDDDI